MPSLGDTEPVEFSDRLIAWYHRHHRDLPWRRTSDPYKIWVSEIILQQTRVVQGLPYYLRFVERFPTVRAMARAEEQEVLRLWQGLGYYSRARNMHATARQIVGEHEGTFPGTYRELLQLKGVGEYTAAAIASFAFGEAVPAVDGNVFRVIARLFGVKTDIAQSSARREFTERAQKLIPADDPATFNQAMIEFGAIQCQPVAPDCLICPFNHWCYAYGHGAQARLPVKSKKAKVRDRYFNYIVLEKDGNLALRERTGKDVWRGLYDFYLVETTREAATAERLGEDENVARWLAAGTLVPPDRTYVHLLSHQRLHVTFWRLQLGGGYAPELPPGLAFRTPGEIGDLPKPILIDTFTREQFFT